MIKLLTKHTWELLTGLDCLPISTYMDTGGCEKVKIIFHIIMFFLVKAALPQAACEHIYCVLHFCTFFCIYSCLFLQYWIQFLHLLQQKCQLQALVFTALFFFFFWHILSFCPKHLDMEQNCVTELNRFTIVALSLMLSYQCSDVSLLVHLSLNWEGR